MNSAWGKPLTPKPPVGRSLGLGLLMLVFAGLPVIAGFNSQSPAVLLAIVIFYLVVAVVLRSRLLTGLLSGAVMGLIFAADVKHADPDSLRLWTLLRVLVGSLIGLLVGLAWDRTESMRSSAAPTKKKKRGPAR